MKTTIIIIAMLAAGVAGLSAEETKAKVSIDELHENKTLVGKLGEPFGKLLRVRCRAFVPDKNKPLSKADESEEWVEIMAADGKLFGVPILMKWRAFQINPVAKPAPGKTIEVWGYETGGFEGMPNGSFEHVPRVAGTGFRFVSSLVALKEIEPKEEKK
ncbi:hypothetical protein OKA04_08225 [Luteolibacter flavescens]|uniref:Uncharacterized protein n=1 Tax=Luteolibacter flavescens TaxID=1859460 RepID=A0ABT3FMB4_9BACT|nr:hypothetical protein [Luteolibacter flavescens]MCW1884711.1 hypothetical protein [Luteolibacter flavescens]